MTLTLLGTGSPAGWPDVHCRCSSCTATRAWGTPRGPTSALLDGTLLLDGDASTPYAAQRAGLDLTGLRHVLLTRPQPGDLAALLGSRTSGAPLDVLAPRGALEQSRHDVAPRSGVRPRSVTAGDRALLGAFDVRVLPGRDDSCVLYDVTGPSGRVLLAPDTGPLTDAAVEAVRDAGFDVVLLEETFGDHVAHGTDHLDLTSFPEQLRRLRAVGALDQGTDVVAVRLSHRNPPVPELSRRLAAWGARVVDDGATLGEPPRHPVVGRTLLIGGARSGKSSAAEALLAAEPAVTYVATSYPTSSPTSSSPADDEWSERVRVHRARRPVHWSTLETLDLVGLLQVEGEPLLIDCLTLWLTRVMDRHGAWDDTAWAAGAEAAVRAETDALAEAWRTTGRRVVAVTNEVGQGLVPETAAGRRFRDQMGRVNAAVAAVTEDVLWCIAGRVTRL